MRTSTSNGFTVFWEIKLSYWLLKFGKKNVEGAFAIKKADVNILMGLPPTRIMNKPNNFE
jgi:hypothetical protein